MGKKARKEPPHCHSGRDGDCNWRYCPQNRPATRKSYCPRAAAWEKWCEESGYEGCTR